MVLYSQRDYGPDTGERVRHHGDDGAVTHADNNRCDELASLAAREQTRSPQ